MHFPWSLFLHFWHSLVVFFWQRTQRLLLHCQKSGRAHHSRFSVLLVLLVHLAKHGNPRDWYIKVPLWVSNRILDDWCYHSFQLHTDVVASMLLQINWDHWKTNSNTIFLTAVLACSFLTVDPWCWLHPCVNYTHLQHVATSRRRIVC